MRSKLLLFEGIPGSGKSTTSHRASLYLSRKGYPNQLYSEGCRHPANLDGYVCVPANEVEGIISRFRKYEAKIKEHLIIDGKNSLIAHSKVMREESEIFRALQPYAIWDNPSYCTYEMFRELHINSWSRFARKRRDEDAIAIFECAFLQDHITELMLYYTMAEREILGHFETLHEAIKELNPTVIYMQQKNAAETIKRISKIRARKDGGPSWADHVADMIAASPYGKLHGLNGYEGMVEFFVRRKQLDKYILETLPIHHCIVDNDEYSWEDNFDRIKIILDGIVS